MPYPAEQISFSRTGQGPPALMIHGNPATRSLWRPLAERLADVRTLWIVDLPGFGQTPAPADRAQYGLQELAATMLAFAELHGLGRYDLVGHSFGGAIAIAMTAQAPATVRTLTAITPMSDIPPPMARIMRTRPLVRTADALWHRAPGGLRRWIIRNWTRLSYGGGYRPERSAEVAIEGDRPGLVRSAAALIAESDYAWYGRMIAALGTLPGPPTLLIGSRRDHVIPYAHFERLCAALPRASSFTFPEGGHVSIWQYPDDIARMVREFWDASEP